MKYVMIALGVVTALAIYARVPHYLDEYEMHGTPPPYEGPKLRHWTNGVLDA